MLYIEDYLPVVKYEGLNTAKNVDFSGSGSVRMNNITLVNSTATVADGSCVINAIAGIALLQNLAALTTSADSFYIKNSKIAASDIVLATLVQPAVSGVSAGTPHISSVQPATGSVTITLANPSGATAAGSIKVAFMVIKAA